MEVAKVQNLFDDMKRVLHLRDWSLKFDFEMDFCDKELKTIHLNENNINGEPIYYIYERLVHEFAHAIDYRKNVTSFNGHDETFFRNMCYVINKCMNTYNKYESLYKDGIIGSDCKTDQNPC